MTVSNELIDALLADYKKPEDLIGENGLLKQRTKRLGDRTSLRGAQWNSLQAALADDAPFTTTLRACSAVMAGLKPQLRALLHNHCCVKTLRTRQMVIDIQAL